MQFLGNGLYFLFVVIYGLDWSMGTENWWANFSYGLLILANLSSPLWIGPIHKWAVVWCHQPCHHNISCHRPCQRHIIFHVCATSSAMWMSCDLAIEFMTFIFIINNGPGLGWMGLRLFYDIPKTSWIELICDDFC